MTVIDLVLQHAPQAAMVARIAEISERPDAVCLYFGRLDNAGHFTHRRRGTSCEHLSGTEERALAQALGGLDAMLCWNSRPDGRTYQIDETEGRAFLTRRNGWTAIAFWDRTGDRRSASNSAFIARGDLTFAQVVRLARQQWPEVWARFTFPVVEVDRSCRPV